MPQSVGSGVDNVDNLVCAREAVHLRWLAGYEARDRQRGTRQR
jgi:hypothetical protein